MGDNNYLRILLYGGVNIENSNFPETNFEKKAKALRAKLRPIIMEHLSTLIFALVAGFVLNWTFNKYGEPKLIIACTVLIAILLFRKGRQQ